MISMAVIPPQIPTTSQCGRCLPIRIMAKAVRALEHAVVAPSHRNCLGENTRARESDKTLIGGVIYKGIGFDVQADEADFENKLLLVCQGVLVC